MDGLVVRHALGFLKQQGKGMGTETGSSSVSYVDAGAGDA
jgi:hypothetical protein